MSSFELSDDPGRQDIDRVHAWLLETYWGRYTGRETFDRAVANSFCVGAFRDGSQIGFARAITDYATFAWVSDVIVAVEARGEGVGRAMVRFMLDHPRLQGLRRWNLNTRDAHGVYAALGFTSVPEGNAYMERLDGSYAAAISPGS